MDVDEGKSSRGVYNLRERNSKTELKRLEFQQIISEAKKHMAENESNLLSRYLSEQPNPKSNHSSLNNSFFDQHPDHKPNYEHIVCNDSTLISQSQTNSSINRGSSRWICDCQVPNKEALLNGELPCMSGCINRALNIECGPRCPVYEICGNRRFQRMEYSSIEPFFAGPNKGWGLRATDLIEKGTFIIEYVGEVISFKEFQRRIRKYERENSPHHYFMSSGPNFFIDAAKKGNWARFINHSCQPNAETQKWNVLGTNCIGIFAIEDIEKDEEITMDYQFIQFGVKEQKCYCGSENCSGVMGVSNKNFQTKVCTKDTKSIEKRAIQLLNLTKIKSSHEITLLLQIMVQECLNQYARYRLLGLLKGCENDSLYTLFRQYNGLELIASYMCDSDTHDWSMKKRILECLILIPITERKQVNTDSRLMEIVEQWSKDPRYCRARIENLITDDINSEETKEADITENIANWTQKDECEIIEISPCDVGSSESNDKPIESQDIGTILSREATIQQERSNWIEPATKEEVIELANNLLAKWEEIPWECYRIPRKERQVIEDILKDQEISSPFSGASGSNNIILSKKNNPAIKVDIKKDETSEKISKKIITKQKIIEKNMKSIEKRLRHREIFEEKIQKLEEAKEKARIQEEQTKNLENSIKKLDQPNRRLLLKIICKALAMHMTKLETILKENTPDKGLEKEIVYRLTSSVQQLSQRLPNLYQMEDITGAILLLVEMTNDCQTIQEIVDNLYNKQINRKLSKTNLDANSNLKTTKDGLPEGWQSSLDPLTGHRFYYNTNLGITQWTFPSVPIVNDYSNDLSKIPLPPQENIDESAPTSHQETNTKTIAISEKKTNRLYAKITSLVHKILKPYTLNNCVTARITSNQDFHHLIKKFSNEFYSKISKHNSSHEELSRGTVEKIKCIIAKHMLSRGAIYTRSKPSQA